MTASTNVSLTPPPAGPAAPVPVEAELDAYRRIAELIDRLDVAAQRRAAAWISDRWGAA
jgi:hypothetical protein